MGQTVRGRDQFAKYKKLIVLLSKICVVFPRRVRISLLTNARRTKGKLGMGIRYVLLKTIAKECGDNVAIHPDVYLLNPQNLTIGSNVSIHPMCYLECGKNGEIYIGDDVSIAHGATIMATSHKFSDNSISIKDQGVDEGTVYICRNVWVGAKVSILINTKVAEGCIIGANSVVTKDTQSGGVYVGAPARRIKDRV